MTSRVHSGFTMIEIVVTLSIIAILAAILTPVVGKYIDDARITRAASDAQSIATAILNFNKDTGKWPIFTSGLNITTTSGTYQVLVGPGDDPACSSCAATWLPASGSRGDLTNILERNTPAYTTSGKFAWRGPYSANIGSDPWGNAYFVNASSLQFGQRKAAFVLSAGPNSAIETTFSQDIGSGSSAVVIGGDDIAARVR